MAHATITFDLETEKDDLRLCLEAQRMDYVIELIGEKVFRPARKHGYASAQINELIAKIGEDDATELIELLEQLYHDILNENLDDTL